MKTDNLIPISSRSAEERKAIASKGGHASTMVRRRKKTVKQLILEMLYDYEVDPKTREDLIRFGFAEPDLCYLSAMLMALFKRAVAGDLQAIRIVAEYCGEDPDLKIKEAELKLKRKDLKFRQELIKQQTVKLRKFNYGDSGDNWLLSYNPAEDPMLEVFRQLAEQDPVYQKDLDQQKKLSEQIVEKQKELLAE